MSKFCTNCGAALNPSAKFCTGCGSAAGTAPATGVNPSETVAAAAVESAATMADDRPSDVQQSPLALGASDPAGMPNPVLAGHFDDEPQTGLWRKFFAWQKLLAIGLLACLLIGGAWVVNNRSDSAVSSDAASSDQFVAANYKDQFLSERDEGVSVISTARMRDYPTTKGTTVVATHQAGEALNGRWVKGVDPSTRWLRVKTDGDNVGYVWEGNLQTDPTEKVGLADLDWSELDEIVSREVSDPDKQIDIGALNIMRQIVVASSSQNVYNELMSVNPGYPPSYNLELFKNNEILILYSFQSHNAAAHNASIILNTRKKSAAICLRTKGQSDWYLLGKRIFRSSSNFNDCPWNLEGVPREVNFYHQN